MKRTAKHLQKLARPDRARRVKRTRGSKATPTKKSGEREEPVIGAFAVDQQMLAPEAVEGLDEAFALDAEPSTDVIEMVEIEAVSRRW